MFVEVNIYKIYSRDTFYYAYILGDDKIIYDVTTLNIISVEITSYVNIGYIKAFISDGKCIPINYYVKLYIINDQLSFYNSLYYTYDNCAPVTNTTNVYECKIPIDFMHSILTERVTNYVSPDMSYSERIANLEKSISNDIGIPINKLLENHIRRLYGINADSTSVIMVNGKQSNVKMYTDQKYVTVLPIDPLIQSYAGSFRNNNRIVSVTNEDGTISTYMCSYKDGKLHSKD
jgi:hypothetical protein